MKQALMKFLKEAVPLVLVLLVVGVILAMSASTTFAIWVGIIVGGTVGLFAVGYILMAVIGTIMQNIKTPKTVKEKTESRRSSRSWWSRLFKESLIVGCYLLGGAVLMGLFMLMFPTYDQMAEALFVIAMIAFILYLLSLAKRGGDLTNVFNGWWQ
jgi:hypothetical protein